MKNYVVKYTGSEKSRVITVSNITILFDENNRFTVDVGKECLKQSNTVYGSREYEGIVKRVYLFLIEKCSCIPYLTIDSAKEALLDIRNDFEIRDLKGSLQKEKDKILAEMQIKVNEKRQQQQGAVASLKRKLEQELSISMNEADTERARWKDQKDLYEKEENEQKRQIISSELEEIYAKTKLSEGKWNRVKNTMKRKISELEKGQAQEIVDIEVLYSQQVNEADANLKAKIIKVSKDMEAQKEKELKLLDDIIKRRYQSKVNKEEKEKTNEKN